MAFYYKAIISGNIRELIQKGVYEKIIHKLMNESTKIFTGEYEYITSQSHGECDFRDMINGQKYDAKILFSTEQCYQIPQGLNRLTDWIQSMLGEINESSRKMLDKDWHGIRSTKLYKELGLRLCSISDDEFAILFIPFPIIPEFAKSIFAQFASDIVGITYDEIVKESPEKYLSKPVFIIYPSIADQKIVLRNLTTQCREYCRLITFLRTFDLRLGNAMMKPETYSFLSSCHLYHRALINNKNSNSNGVKL